MFWLRLCAGVLLIGPALAEPEPEAPQNFIEAKKLLKPFYQEHHPYTFYCGCRFNEQGIVVDCPLGSEDLIGEKVEWEHIVPASLLGKDLECWSAEACAWDPTGPSARTCCQKTSETFQWREANLYNLVPAVKSVNRARSNYRPGWVFHKGRSQHLCGLWIDKKSRRIEPDPPLRGFIARTYLHMHELYDYPLTKKDKMLFEKWNQQYPADEWEKNRAQLLNQYYSVDENRSIPD